MIKLKENVIKKWPSNDFCNVNLFLELMSSRNKDIDPKDIFGNRKIIFNI